MKELEIRASSVENAIEQGLAELKVTRDDVDIEIISKGGFLRKAAVKLIVKEKQAPISSEKSSPVNITKPQSSTTNIPTKAPAPTISTKMPALAVPPRTVSTKETASAVGQNSENTRPNHGGNPRQNPKYDRSPMDFKTKEMIETPYDELDDSDKLCVDFIKQLIRAMGFDCSLKVASNTDRLSILICGEDTHYAIGYRGETLDHIQYLTLLVANKSARFRKKLIVDAEGYREKRAETLIALSKSIAYKVSKSNCAVELEPMNPFERRVIHTTLQDDKFVTTSSEGDEPNRYVVISPKNQEQSTADMYDVSSKQNFKKTGVGKTRSFGNKTRKF